ncbi:ubiquitin-conjugating enzyme E2 Z-like [Dermacentor albipictus]|uniref:ubiquitin-conjugating enzyme E2 Z-like n=1 Tax=Dermacentor albipictus TaxID=60249 RepID=UPI0038FCB432
MASQPSPTKPTKEASVVIRRSRVLSPSKRNCDVSPMYLLRARRDIGYIMADPPPGIHIASEENKITHINTLVMGSSDTPYAGGLLQFDIVCPNEYPIEPPRAHFLTTDTGLVQLNLNLYSNGEVSFSVLGTFDGPHFMEPGSVVR